MVDRSHLLNKITPPLKLIHVTTYAAGCRAAFGESDFSIATLTVGSAVAASDGRGSSPGSRAFSFSVMVQGLA